jgi:hypothetical protein
MGLFLSRGFPPVAGEMDSNFRFRASSDYAGVGVLRLTWAV